MAHPAGGSRCDIAKERGTVLHKHLCLTVFTYRCLLYIAAQHKHHQLGPIAESQHRDSHLKQFSAAGWCSLLIAAVRTAGEDDSLGIHSLDLL